MIGVCMNLQKTMLMRNLFFSYASFAFNGRIIFGCSSYIYLSGELLFSRVYSICIQKYGTKACSLYPEDRDDHQYRIEIGDAKSNRSMDQVYAEPLVLLEWSSVLGLPVLRWSYTVMMMAIYDNTAGQVVSKISCRVGRKSTESSNA
ncbi:unnamed protein product [Angiostrongylus costaricensis]|uniref:DNA-directed RNA polymerase n=1 Tax=Angiostrongylus costaricensis TaxID=334426 RepID=A0A0R3Q1U2_ANGCS|nr:unnamed protein product [Angiostrongylus costaricensis]